MPFLDSLNSCLLTALPRMSERNLEKVPFFDSTFIKQYVESVTFKFLSTFSSAEIGRLKRSGKRGSKFGSNGQFWIRWA